jgi:hypothetical protein
VPSATRGRLSTSAALIIDSAVRVAVARPRVRPWHLIGACMLCTLSLFFASADVAERVHTQYDPDLGWANIPNLRVKDMYGPGRHLTIDSHGFRSTAMWGSQYRGALAVCSGDSFTLGYGVDDSDTWCALIGRSRLGISTVNMGQGGYGLDQIYLWYMRDSHVFDESVHVVALTTWDLGRSAFESYNGYGKPFLSVVAGEIRQSNVPVPPRHPLVPLWIKISRLGYRLGLSLPSFESADTATLSREATGRVSELAAALVDSLATHHSRRGSTLVVVYLPSMARRADTSRWRAVLRDATSKAGVTFWDLADAFESRAVMERMYIRPGEIDYAGAAGHYTAAGNAAVAALLVGRLEVLLRRVITVDPGRTSRPSR